MVHRGIKQNQHQIKHNILTLGRNRKNQKSNQKDFQDMIINNTVGEVDNHSNT